jgi:aminopeptidase N
VNVLVASLLSVISRCDSVERDKLGDDLDLSTTKLKEVPIADICFESDWETCTIFPGFDIRSLQTEFFILCIKHVARFNEHMKGFYLSFWKNQTIATTQFEATEARRCFPCWDEPGFKATFSVDIKVPDCGLHVISNMPILESNSCDHHGLMLHRFEKSPPMCPYLLAFVIGKFDFLSARSKNGVQVRTYVVPGKLEQSRFAIQTAINALDFFVDFFALDFPLVSNHRKQVFSNL